MEQTMDNNFLSVEDFLSLFAEETEFKSKQRQRKQYQYNPSDFSPESYNITSISHRQLAAKTVAILDIFCTKGLSFLGRRLTFTAEERFILKQALEKPEEERTEEEFELIEKLESYSELEEDLPLDADEKKQLTNSFALWFKSFNLSRMSPGGALLVALLMIIGSRFLLFLQIKIDK